MSSDLLSYLASVSARSLCLFGIAALAVAVLRVRSAAARHAAWTVVMGGMLLLALAAPVLPPLPVRVLKAAPDGEAARIADLPPSPAPEALAPNAPHPARPATRLRWPDAAAAVYGLGALVLLARLAFGWLFTRRLMRAARPVEAEWAAGVYGTTWISVPMTAGWLRPKILLPGDWESWDGAKLEAVLAHERTHIRRADWLIGMLAGVNRCIFWFHPLAWWLERRLAALAEQACDDAALLLVPGASYAQALLDMAAAVTTAQGRLVWEAMAMAKAAEVRQRIERILDETRQIPRGLTRSRWAAIVACGVPLVWLASVAHLERAAAQDQPRTPAAMSEFLQGRPRLGPADVTLMEQYLAANPNDVEVRTQLILYYYANGVREPRLSHIFWLVANHPEHPLAAMLSQGILPRASSMNDAADYQRVLGLWRQTAAAQANQPLVLGNAAQFLQAVGEYDDAERLLLQAKGLQPAVPTWSERLGKLYATAILGATGDPKFPNSNPAFANRVQAQLDSSDDTWMLRAAASALVQAARRSEPGRPLPPGTLNLDDHPALVPAVDLGARLMARVDELAPARVPPGMVIRTGPGVIGGVPGGVAGGVIGGVLSSTPRSMPVPEAAVALAAAPPVTSRVDPVYPPLALQARISGVVNLQVTIHTDGTVQHIQVISGHPLLVQAALEAVRQWRFQPPASDLVTQIQVPFTLSAAMAQDLPRLPDSTPRKSAAPGRIRIGPNVQAVKLTHRVDPVYPSQARAEGIEGNVTLQVTIGEDGMVQSADPLEGNPILAAAAQEAVKQWTYAPTLFNNQPIIVITTVTVPFELK